MQQEFKKPIIAALAGVLALATLTACNTVSGAGRDIEAGGKTITDAAEDTKEAITE